MIPQFEEKWGNMMALWSVDLTTEDGADSAAQMGAYACFVGAVLGAIGVALSGGLQAQIDKTAAIGILSVGLAEILVFVVAGFRLRAGRGAIWGSVAALLLILEIVLKLVTMQGLPGVVINVILLIVIVNGIRGARALSQRGLTVEEAAEIFN